MNVKPGDLAIVIRALVTENIGKIVMVLRFVGDGRYGINYCEVEYDRPAIGVSQDGTRATSKTHRFPDAWLLPVSGLPDTEDTDTEQPIKEVA